jgi:predicted nuclease with TOPRIM domain
MSDLKGRLNEIKEKIRQLIIDKDNLANENIQLNKKNEELLGKTKEQEIEISELINKNNYIKISQSVKQSEGNEDVKNKIDELVREIDNCIRLLNK